MSDNKFLTNPSKTKIETALDIASFVTSAVPWIGGPVSNVLSGISVGRKISRVHKILEDIVSNLKEFKSEASESYVETEEFEELLTQSLNRVANERSEEKRALYCDFLTDAIKFPRESYDEQMRFLRALEEIQVCHIKLLRALVKNPQQNSKGLRGLQFPSLRFQLSDMSNDRVRDLVFHLNSLCITYIHEEGQMLTLTPFGKRFIRFIVKDS